MDDFKDFLQKALRPMRIDGTDRDDTVRSTALHLLFAKVNDMREAKDYLPADELRGRYDAVMSYLVADAADRRALSVFIDVVTEKLAHVAVSTGIHGASRIVCRLGANLESISADIGGPSDGEDAYDKKEPD